MKYTAASVTMAYFLINVLESRNLKANIQGMGYSHTLNTIQSREREGRKEERGAEERRLGGKQLGGYVIWSQAPGVKGLV